MDATAPRLMRSLAARVPDKDTLYRTKLIEQAAKLHDVIAMGLGDPDLPTPPHVVEAAQAAIARGETRYTHPAGMPKLRQAIADLLRQEYGLDYVAEETMVTAGTQEGVMLLMLALVNPGRRGLAAVPAVHVVRHGGRALRWQGRVRSDLSERQVRADAGGDRGTHYAAHEDPRAHHAEQSDRRRDTARRDPRNRRDCKAARYHCRF